MKKNLAANDQICHSLLAMKEIKVRVKNNYGYHAIYPACADSQFFCDIAGTKTLTPSLVALLSKRGWTITEIL
jgi:hypothetical protein